MTPSVSVVLATRNRAHLLSRAIRSVLAQSRADLELIVVDDASTDGTAAVVAAFADPRIRYVRLDTQAHVAAARNRGIREARASLIAFQDDDDRWLVEKLDRQVRALDAAGPQAGLCLAGYLRLETSGVRYIGGDAEFAGLDWSRGQGPGYSLIATPGWLVRRRVLDEVGLFDEQLQTWEDWELGLRIWQASRLAFVDEPLFVQDHVEGRGLMYNEALYGPALTRIVEKHGHLWADRPAVTARHAYIIGRAACSYGGIADGRRWLRESLRHRPIALKTWATLLASVGGATLVVALTRLFRRLAGA